MDSVDSLDEPQFSGVFSDIALGLGLGSPWTAAHRMGCIVESRRGRPSIRLRYRDFGRMFPDGNILLATALRGCVAEWT